MKIICALLTVTGSSPGDSDTVVLGWIRKFVLTISPIIWIHIILDICTHSQEVLPFLWHISHTVLSSLSKILAPLLNKPLLVYTLLISQTQNQKQLPESGSYFLS